MLLIWKQSGTAIFKKLDLLIYLKVKEEEKDTKRQKPSSIHGLPPSDHNILKLGAKFWVSHMGGRGPSTWATILLPFQIH